MPVLIVINGLPCTGKSTLARHVARARGWPLLAKDDYKERVFAHLGWHDRAYSRRVSALAWDLLFAAAADLVGAGASCVLEGNFRAGELPPLRLLGARRNVVLVEIVCSADPALIRARLARRAEGRTRHPGHLDQELEGELAAELALGPALGLGLDAERIAHDSDGADSAERVLHLLAARLDGNAVPEAPAPESSADRPP